MDNVELKKWATKLMTIEASAEREVRQLYLDTIEEITELIATAPKGVAANFSFGNLPKGTQTKVDTILKKLSKNVETIIVNATGAADALMEERFEDIQNTLYIKGNGAEILTAKESLAWLQTESTRAATEAFVQRKVGGLGLSDRVWKRTELLKSNIETALYQGIEAGTSAAELSRQVREALNQPNKLFRRVRQPDGTLALSAAAKAYHPGQGVYRSSYKNAIRMTGTEINKAYRNAFSERIQSKDWITGKRIRLSNNHTCKDGSGGLIRGWSDECDVLAGLYPKDFVWDGWHVNCYSDDTEVLTDKGWQLFKDIDIDADLVWSLNPDTRQMEWSKVMVYMERDFEGEMCRFHNLSLDILVTPDHPMLYLAKANGAIKRTNAGEFRHNQGAILRTGLWEGEYQDEAPSLAFCEFMGYWLADGHVSKGYEVSISQRHTDPNCVKIIACIVALGFSYYQGKDKIHFYSKAMTKYLSQFGHAYDKFVPLSIKDSNANYIKAFLDAFISCDGHISKPKSFTGNRGGKFEAKEGKRTYFTTSPQMAADLGELILKVGKRPSYRIDKTEGKIHKFRNGEYRINHDCIRISECNGQTASVFQKSRETYNGVVYDLELQKNHIMYLRRKGKCFWGSNCRCEQIIEHLDPEQAILDFKNGTTSGVQTTEAHAGYKKWIDEQAKKAEASGSGAWAKRLERDRFLSENGKYRK